MEIFSSSESYKLYQGNMLDMLDVIESNSIDAIVTDPPYELNFMNKNWDNSGIAFQKETWEKCLKVLKPGGYLLSFGGSRTFHRIACAIEDAGFEIRDTIMWIYGSGFPKSMSISKGIEAKETYGVAGTTYKKQIELSGEGQSYTIKAPNNGIMGEIKEFERKEYIPQSEMAKKWDGWGTQLKPAYEPVIVARKPFKGSLVDNVLKYGVGGLNIDGCRVGVEERTYKGAGSSPQKIDNHEKGDTGIGMLDGRGKDLEFTVNGRFPSNVILTYDETDFEEVCGGMPNSGSGNNGTPYNYAGREYNNKDSSMFNGDKPQAPSNYNDNDSAARYFYCAKASKRDRDEGLELFDTKQCTGGGGIGDYLTDVNSCSGKFGSEKAPHKNTHPTVKPVDLMQYLVRLVTPPNGTILDPFNGSGSTGKAAMYENKDRNANYKYIGIELTPEYLPISKARIEYAINYVDVVEEKPMSAEKKKLLNNQMNLFDLSQ